MAKSSVKTNNADGERYDAIAPYEYEHEGKTNTGWWPVGRAFPNANGGFTVRLRAVPPAQKGEVVIVVKKREPKDDKADSFDLP